MKTNGNATQPRLPGFDQLEAPRLERRVARIAHSRRAARSPNADLVGRTFYDGTSRVVVRELSTTNPAHVVVEREHDGHVWTTPAGVVRLIVGRPARRRAA